MMRRLASLFVIVAFLISMVILPGTPAPAVQATPHRFDPPQAVKFETPPATLRTIDEMLADEATHVPLPPQAIPFQTSMNPAAYAAAKAAAAATPLTPRPAVRAAPSLAVTVGPLNCDGEDETLAGAFPPDDDGAFGFSATANTIEFVQTTNSHVTVWDALKAVGVGCSAGRLFDISLNSFFGYSNKFIFDPRVVHDDTYSRWVISAEAFPESATGPQFQFLAVSVSDDARGPYFMIRFDTTPFTCTTSCLPNPWDFPQLGMDDQAIVLTAHVFDSSGAFLGSRWVFINKQHLYYGLGGTFCILGGGIANLFGWAPPKVLDLNNTTWLVDAPGGSSLQLAAVTATGQICPIVLATPTVSVPAYTIPPSAPQPNTNQVLDTHLANFQNRSTQVGDIFLGQQTVLWQVHTINIGGRATPRIYRIVVSTTPPTEQDTIFSASSTSFDFNASIVANPGNTIAVTWSSTDTSINAQVRVGACPGAPGVCSPGSGALVFQSTVPLVGNLQPGTTTFQRWGDYSYPAIGFVGARLFAAGVNEEINNPDDASGHTWGTRWFSAVLQ